MTNLPTKLLTSFYYNDELYIRCVPAKALFHSTLVHEVVNRGDVFAIRVSDQKLTIVPGKAKVTFLNIPVQVALSTKVVDDLFPETLPLPT